MNIYYVIAGEKKVKKVTLKKINKYYKFRVIYKDTFYK